MELPIEIVDPRGYKVCCSDIDLQWFLHGKHDENKDQIKRHHVISCIEDPRMGMIFSSNSDKNCAIYYKIFKSLPVELQVVVRFDKENSGRITTVHYCSHRSLGEMLIWPPSQQKA